MSSWIEKRAEFQRRFDSLSQENIQGLITELNTVVGNYISNAGLSQEPNKGNPLNIKITELIERAENIKQRYSILNNDILVYLKNNAKDTNITGFLSENGELQIQINRLEKLQDKMKIDVETSVARDKLLRSRDTAVTPHQLFVLDRPVRKGLIPYLWVISVLFIGVGVVIFKMTMPSFITATTTATNTTTTSIY